MKPGTPSYQTCPFCHTPVALARYEFASDGVHTWRICPECDHALLMTDDAAGTIAVSLKPAAVARDAHAAPAAELLHA